MSKRNYKSEYKNYHARPEQIKNRAMRNAARALLMEKGVVRKGDGQDVDHILPISKGGGNAINNLRAINKRANRSFPRTKRAKMR